MRNELQARINSALFMTVGLAVAAAAGCGDDNAGEHSSGASACTAATLR